MITSKDLFIEYTQEVVNEPIYNGLDYELEQITNG